MGLSIIVNSRTKRRTMTPDDIRAICIIDDDDAVRDSLKVLLESYGMVVRDYSSPEKILSENAVEECDCLVLDLHMPTMSGLELLEALRAKNVDTPAVMVTSSAEPRLAIRLEKAGLSALLMKPVNERELLAGIAQACQSIRF